MKRKNERVVIVDDDDDLSVAYRSILYICLLSGGGMTCEIEATKLFGKKQILPLPFPVVESIPSGRLRACPVERRIANR